MNVREWALIAFSILAEMSVGAFLVHRVLYVFATRKAGAEEADRLSDRALLAIIPVLGLGLIASLFHLGNPLNAYRAVTNLGSSWLSREVLFGVLFAVLGAIFSVMQWRKVSSIAVRNIIAWIASLVGLALVYSMSQVYMLPTQPAWNTLATPISFFTTAFLLGALAMGTAFVINYGYIRLRQPDCADTQCTLTRDALRWIAVAALIMLGVELVVTPLSLAYLVSGGAQAAKSASMLAESYGILFALRLILVFVGAGVFGLFIYQNAMGPGREKVMGGLAYGAFALVLVAEVLGRYLFYVTQVQITL
jgi:anaerobic dimethyl sulfoxide reductase subunit C (anchor subunit)